MVLGFEGGVWAYFDAWMWWLGLGFMWVLCFLGFVIGRVG